jgi:hypothetical protein
MFLIKWWSALLTFIVVISIYIYVKKRKLGTYLAQFLSLFHFYLDNLQFIESFSEINWGSSIDAQIYKRSLEYSLKLTQTEEHVKNFRPNFLVLSGPPPERPALCDLFGSLAQSRSLMIFGNVILVNSTSFDCLRIDWLFIGWKERWIKSEIKRGTLHVAQNEENKGLLYRSQRKDVASRSIGFNAGNFNLNPHKILF